MPETFEDIRELRENWEATLPHVEYRRRMVAKVEEMAAGEPGRAELLECLASDREEPTTIDARVEVVRALYGLGRDEEAAELTRELVRSPSRDDVTVGLHAALREVLELAGRLLEAQRAYTIGLKELDPNLDDEDELTMDESLCLAGRYRLRRALGLGSDGYDRFFEQAYPDAAEAIRERATLT